MKLKTSTKRLRKKIKNKKNENQNEKKTTHKKLGLKNKIKKILVVSVCVLLFIIFHA
jgi:hypothetical protein